MGQHSQRNSGTVAISCPATGTVAENAGEDTVCADKTAAGQVIPKKGKKTAAENYEELNDSSQLK